MAILNGLYIHVVTESVSGDVDSTSHPVEEGLPTTDTVRAKALSITLNGKIVDYGTMKSEQVISKLEAWKNAGTLLLFKGRTVASSMQIHSFNADYNNMNSGGADFTMELVQVRIAKSAYVPKKASTSERENAAKKNPEIKVGSIVVFKGGPVYVSSDAKKPAATRSRSTCECTKISTKSWSIHQYHLISKDNGKVCGWVDLANIEGLAPTNTGKKTNAGTQQTKKKVTAASTKANITEKTNTIKSSNVNKNMVAMMK